MKCHYLISKNVYVGLRFEWFRFVYSSRCVTVYMHVFVVCTHVVNTNTDVVREVGEHCVTCKLVAQRTGLSRPVAGCARDESLAYDPVEGWAF